MSWVWQAQGGGNGGGGVAAAAKVAALQSNITGNAVGMWSLQTTQAARNITGTDRSGNGYNLNPINAYNAPDLIPGQCCLTPWKSYTAAPPVGLYPQGMRRSVNTAALQIAGSMSVTLRAYVPTWADAGAAANYMYLMGCAEYTDGSAAGNALYTMVLNNTAGRSLGYFCQNGVHVGVVYFSTLTTDDGQWHFFSLRRNAATGVVTLGVDGSYQSSAALALPSGGGNAKLYVGCPPAATFPVFSDIGLTGGIADVCVWPVELTLAQVESLRAQAMGL